MKGNVCPIIVYLIIGLYEILMNEIELFEKIENSIHEGTYNELLNDSEKELQAFLSRYKVEDIMILINRIILFHNYNMLCKEFDDDRFFYMNYFKSYYFDYPCMEIYEYLSFFHDNIELCKNVLGDEKLDECLNLMCYLQNIENNMKNENLWFKIKCDNITVLLFPHYHIINSILQTYTYSVKDNKYYLFNLFSGFFCCSATT